MVLKLHGFSWKHATRPIRISQCLDVSGLKVLVEQLSNIERPGSSVVQRTRVTKRRREAALTAARRLGLARG